MNSEIYLRSVLTVIAAALVYLCVIVTPWPVASAQTGQIVGAPTPGVSTGPAEVVIVGWKLETGLPVHVGNEVRVTGQVMTSADSTTRVVITGWEDSAPGSPRGSFQPLSSNPVRALPVVVRQPTP